MKRQEKKEGETARIRRQANERGKKRDLNQIA